MQKWLMKLNINVSFCDGYYSNVWLEIANDSIAYIEGSIELAVAFIRALGYL